MLVFLPPTAVTNGDTLLSPGLSDGWGARGKPQLKRRKNATPYEGALCRLRDLPHGEVPALRAGSSLSYLRSCRQHLLLDR